MATVTEGTLEGSRSMSSSSSWLRLLSSSSKLTPFPGKLKSMLLLPDAVNGLLPFLLEGMTNAFCNFGTLIFKGPSTFFSVSTTLLVGFLRVSVLIFTGLVAGGFGLT